MQKTFLFLLLIFSSTSFSQESFSKIYPDDIENPITEKQFSNISKGTVILVKNELLNIYKAVSKKPSNSYIKDFD